MRTTNPVVQLVNLYNHAKAKGNKVVCKAIEQKIENGLKRFYEAPPDNNAIKVFSLLAYIDNFPIYIKAFDYCNQKLQLSSFQTHNKSVPLILSLHYGDLANQAPCQYAHYTAFTIPAVLFCVT